MTYTIQYNPQTGQPTGILRDDGASIPLDPANGDFQAFLAWNAQQPAPLDYTTPYLSLAQAQDNAVAAIDARTAALLAAGFAYTPQGQSTAYNFGLDAASVLNWHGMAIAQASLTYPFAIAAVDGTVVNLASQADLQEWYAAGVMRSAAIQQGGIALKAQVAAATTVDQVAAIQDTRT